MRATVNSARLAWNNDAPDWVLVLAEECDRAKSQRTVGAAIGYSPTVVNQVIKNSYPGNLSKVEDAVRGKFMGATVVCPIAGEITKDICLKHQARPFAATSPDRVKLYRACRQCPHSHLQQGGADDQSANSKHR